MRSFAPSDTASDADDLTDRLLRAAIEVFVERGIEKAGVALIARQAGVTTGAIYSRWAGKHDLLLDALDVVLIQQVAELIAAGPDADVSDVLTALGTDLLQRDPASDALLLEAMVMARRDPEFRAMFNARLESEESQLAALIDNGKQAGLIDPALSTHAITTLCHAITFGFVVQGAINRPGVHADDWHQVIERLVAAALPVSDPTDQNPRSSP